VTAALVAPHIDYQRGGHMYARAYATLPVDPPELVIVFGTDHNGTEHPFTLTRKPFATPLGDVATDVALVDSLAARVRDPASLFADELHHRGEHSIELQAVWLRRVYGDATPPVLPVLCGSLHRAIADGGSPNRVDPRVPEMLELLAGVVAGRRTLIIAGADLAHVGPRFGDDVAFLDEGRRVVARADHAALDAVVAGDAESFFGAVAAERDRFRICGLAPIYHTLALAPGRRGTLLGYDQCLADDDGASFVSIAAVAI
jgi:AmmeMemoRadiSam system protein B